MAGRVPTEILEADELERRPPRTVPAMAPRPAQARGDLALDADEQADVVGRLRALGYVE
jgi:hypothetical protein